MADVHGQCHWTSDKSRDGAEMEEEVVVKDEDVDAGFHIPLFGSDTLGGSRLKAAFNLSPVVN